MRTILALFMCLALSMPAAAGEVSIGTLRTRDHEVRISAGDPPRYTVTDRRGRVLARDARIEEVARRFPDVHRALTRGVAGREDAMVR
jgi:hypothetical protein